MLVSHGRDTTRNPLHEVIPLQAPYAFSFSSSTYCNFKCVYCVHSVVGKAPKPQNFAWEDFLKVVEQAQELSPSPYKIVRLHGLGEPLINPRIADMVAYLKKVNFAERIELTTNASLLTPDLSSALIEGGLTRLLVSVQGISAKHYKDVSGVTIDFDKFIEQLKFFYEHRKQCHIRIKTVDTALQGDESSKFFEIFGAVADTVHIDSTIPIFDIEYPEIVASRKNQNLQAIDVATTNCCSQIFFNLQVEPNGDVLPCCGYPYPLLGNIHTKSVKEMWNGEAHARLMRMHLQGCSKCIPVCADCGQLIGQAMPEDRLDEYASKVLQQLSAL